MVAQFLKQLETREKERTTARTAAVGQPVLSKIDHDSKVQIGRVKWCTHTFWRLQTPKPAPSDVVLQVASERNDWTHPVILQSTLTAQLAWKSAFLTFVT